ncbi:hypothetical protein LTR09_009902 [Extremus antarcticus]|uniref:Magnesium chelatase n=1 Tax=Extremus antarcticus TaxID=702011 RepID=A0AAJ0DES0_9PEZI|nr:hypothetical protein LTR09_009902 [Extremus antarcticus]
MDGTLQQDLQALGDLELAILVSLVAQEHCIFSTDHSRHDLRDELDIICRAIFGLQSAVIQCGPATTVDDFNEGILVHVSIDAETPIETRRGYGFPPLTADNSSARSGRFGSNTLDTRRIADVIIAVDLDTANENVQVQALELIRTKRVFTRTAMHSASRDFMVLAITSSPNARLSKHLNDLFCISHFHSAEYGLQYSDDQPADLGMPSFMRDSITALRTLVSEVHLSPELAAYLHNVAVFMRNSRYISGGVTATATRQLRAIAKVLAPLHGLDYVPPSLVALAAHKIYPHRLKLATAHTERSLQWGSDPEAVKRLLDGVTIEGAIDDVLASLETPL